MKLLMISGDRSLGQGKQGAFYNTLEEFHKYWERIDIICPRARGSAKNGVLSLLTPAVLFPFRAAGGPQSGHPVFRPFDNVFIYPSPWPLILQPFWILKKGKEIYREQGFNLMTVHEYPPFYNGIGARMLWSKIRVPYVLEIFHIPGYPKAADLKEKIYRRLFYFFIKYDCRKAKAIRVMNSQVAEKMVALGVPKSKINLIPAIYLDFDIFKPMDLEKNYDLIFVGRLVKNKGINLLLDAANKLKIQNPNFKLLIVGDGPLEENLKFKIENLKLKDNIRLYGWAENQEEISRLLNQSKVLVMPSYNEGGPRVVAEAMACGIPILATPVGIVADILQYGQPGSENSDSLRDNLAAEPPSGFLLPGQFGEIINWDAKDIAKKASQLLTNESMYKKYSGAGLATAGRFEKRSAIKNYAEKLQGLI